MEEELVKKSRAELVTENVANHSRDYCLAIQTLSKSDTSGQDDLASKMAVSTRTIGSFLYKEVIN